MPSPLLAGSLSALLGTQQLPTTFARAKSMTWLQRSGQTWKLHASFACNVVGFVGIAVSIVLPWTGARAPWLLLLATFGSVLLLILAPIVVALPRCDVCGLWLESSSAGRSQRDRLHWLSSVERCPVCDDDGSASPDSRERWRSSNRPPEPSYWSRRRLAIAVAVVVGVPLLACVLAHVAAPFIVAAN